ncbi:helix-turn-helix domain-containing protein [Bacillus siamensis]|uniref:helix-turn-helix transcriptional regulator n=1 Tax=Bacillus TaxID=1386 RepID=UPI0003A4491C|nr:MULTISPECIES: helix-turn-helix domain-containing protein [Bacillus]QII23580.1 helix-turn-helix domain-containing protein [Bacillus altitudinis]QQD82645.1 helix-turn-helix domain-containing protein [Bacillus siamensis]
MNTSKVRFLRKLHGFNQDVMAKTLGITKATYSKKENGSIKFSLEESKILADFFETTIDELFFDKKPIGG